MSWRTHLHTARLMFVQNWNNSLKQECMFRSSKHWFYILRIDYQILESLLLFQFGSRKASILTGGNGVPSQKYGETHVDTLEMYYGRGDRAIVNSVTIKGEWFELRLYLSMHCSTLLMAEVLMLLTADSTLGLTYPNFVKLAQVYLTLPISTADCKRAFSTMHQIKT